MKVVSFTRPVDEIFHYSNWFVRGGGADEWRLFEVEQYRYQGKRLTVKLVGLDRREQAEDVVGKEVAIDRSQLATLSEGEYYWNELIGLSVYNLQEVYLGQVDHLLETGANDVLVISREYRTSGRGEREQVRLVPWIPEVIVEVDSDRSLIRVDWDEDF